MSEPMTTVEIEDVLSSIRRLVSEDLRPTHKLVSAALQKGASKLILTPALRIVAKERSALPDGNDAFDEQRGLASVLQDIDVGPAADVLPMFGSVRLHDHATQAERMAMDATDRSGLDADFLASAMSRINGLTSVEADAPPAAQSETIEAVVAAVGAAVGPEEWEVDGGDPAPQAAAWSDAVWLTAEGTERDLTPADSADEVLLLQRPIMGPDRGDIAPGDLQSDTMVPPPAENPGPDLGSPDSIVFNEDGPADLQPALAAGRQQQADDEADDNDDYLNEDVLREIVRDMIREELQGTLGERITRNVRKLVRAEVNRALAAHDYGDRASRA